MEGIGHTRDQARRTTGEYGNITHQGAGNMGGDYSSNGTGTGVTTPLGGGGYGHESQQQHHGGGFPTDAGAAAAAYGGTDTTGAFPADIGATTGHGMTGIHAPDIGAGYAGSGTQGQIHHGGGVTDKIKDKLPGGHKDEQRASTTTAETYEGEHEKKGIMEKIKEKLPGPNN